MYCSFCGQKVYDEENFCPNCGHKIDKSRVVSGNKETNIIKKDAQVVDIDSFLSEISQETNNVVKAKENKVEVSQNATSKYSNASVISPPAHPTTKQSQDYPFHVKTENKYSNYTTSNYTLSKIFMIIGAVYALLHGGIVSLSLYGANFMAILNLISPLWTLPMIICLFDYAKCGEKPSIAFKICSLIFVSGLGGIFMLCNK